MAGGPWTIDGMPNKYGCLRAVRTTATKRAMQTQQDVFVRFLGSKQPNNSDATKSDFKVTPLGHYDFSIDPTWKGR